MGKWLGKILCVCGILLWINPDLGNRMYLQHKMGELGAKWYLFLVVIGFFLMNYKEKRKSHH